MDELEDMFPDYFGNDIDAMAGVIDSQFNLFLDLAVPNVFAYRFLSQFHNTEIAQTAPIEWASQNMHKILERISLSPRTSNRQITAITLPLSALTRYIGGLPTTQYLWRERNIVPIVRPQIGLHADEAVLYPSYGEVPEVHYPMMLKQQVYACAMRFYFKSTDTHPVNEQQIQKGVLRAFQHAEETFAHGIVPLLEFVLPLSRTESTPLEGELVRALIPHLDTLGDRRIMLSLPLPNQPGEWDDLLHHPNVIKVLAHVIEPSDTVRLRLNHGLPGHAFVNCIDGLKDAFPPHLFEQALLDQLEALSRASRYGMKNHV